MLTNSLIALALLFIAFLIFVSIRPSEFRVARSTTISAPPAVPFAQINDLHKWQEISPYAKMDLTAKYTFEGPPVGPGASISWVGNSKVGEGKMTIAASRPDELIRMNLQFLKPFAANAVAEFTFEPTGNRTVVTWSYLGSKSFICKAMSLFMNMDEMVGSAFSDGLASLKAVSENKTQGNPS